MPNKKKNIFARLFNPSIAHKMLFGLANFDAYLNNAYLELGENQWNAVTNAVVHTNL